MKRRKFRPPAIPRGDGGGDLKNPPAFAGGLFFDENRGDWTPCGTLCSHGVRMGIPDPAPSHRGEGQEATAPVTPANTATSEPRMGGTATHAPATAAACIALQQKRRSRSLRLRSGLPCQCGHWLQAACFPGRVAPCNPLAFVVVSVGHVELPYQPCSHRSQPPESLERPQQDSIQPIVLPV